MPLKKEYLMRWFEKYCKVLNSGTLWPTKNAAIAELYWQGGVCWGDMELLEAYKSELYFRCMDAWVVWSAGQKWLRLIDRWVHKTWMLNS